MTSLEHLTAALQLFLALATIGILWFRWRTYRIDALRQKLFALRDELFDYANEGAIPFDDKAYLFLRHKLNGMIRFAHQVSFARLVMSLLFFFSSRPDFVQKQHRVWLDALDHVSPDARKKLLATDEQMSVIIVQHMVTGSPILILFVGIFVPLAVFSVAAMHLWGAVSRNIPGLDLLEAQAFQNEAA